MILISFFWAAMYVNQGDPWMLSSAVGAMGLEMILHQVDEA